MFHESNVESIRAFYDRWRSTIFRFCQLFVGDEDRAEKATEVAFLTYYRAGAILDLEVVPTALLGKALEAVRSLSDGSELAAQDLRSAILCLPLEERSVFILRSVLDFDLGRIAEVTACEEDRVERIWKQSLSHLRQFLPREFLQERPS